VKFTYDRLGRRISSTVQRGVVHEYSFDLAGRLEADSVTSLGDAGQNVDGAVRRIGYTYITSFDAASGGFIVNQVAYTYDGAVRLLIRQRGRGAGPAGEYRGDSAIDPGNPDTTPAAGADRCACGKKSCDKTPPTPTKTRPALRAVARPVAHPRNTPGYTEEP
jgi:YD repeat-containing protein